MGLDYEFYLYFPRDEIWNVLDSVGEMAENTSGKQTDIIFPDRKMTLPFTSNFKTDPICFNDSLRDLQFDTALYFEPDEVLEDYVRETERDIRKRGGDYINWTLPRDEYGRIPIGYIYLHITLNSEDTPNLVRFDFFSATTSMGILFTKSQSIQRAFVRLLEAHNGVYGHIQDSDYLYMPVLIYPAGYNLTDAQALLQ